jgi:UDP-N-acetylglucosamine 2-epimerase
MKIMVIAGTRPEAIKVAPIVIELKKRPQIYTLLCNSGQHKQMLDEVFADFKLVPDIALNVMSDNQSLASLTARLFESFDRILEKEKPDLIVVQGDTTTVMVAAMCAYYRGIKIAHIEAGLRSFNKHAPFPEEVNRQIVTRIADLHFAPTRNAYANLIREGIDPDYAFVTGNTVIDSLMRAKELSLGKDEYLDSTVKHAIADGKRIVLITAHRRENFGKGFDEICNAINSLANKYEDCLFVFPVHLNPNVQVPVKNLLKNTPRVYLVPPLSYFQFQALLRSSYLVLTDSGGLQEEAPALCKPVLIMRDVTERPEGVKTGCARLVGTKKQSIVDGVSLLLDCEDEYIKMTSAQNPYGHGHSAERIVDAILRTSELK